MFVAGIVGTGRGVVPKVLHCLQNRGNDSYNTFWVMVTPLGREMLQANQLTNQSQLALWRMITESWRMLGFPYHAC
jgi:diadenosine tetraphosphate (Ap4A) HIT family hydrolase